MTQRRGKQFTVDAESVQGNAGATVTFRALKVRTQKAIIAGDVKDPELLAAQIVGWTGIVGDNGESLLSPTDDPSVLDELYIHEQTALVRLLLRGPLEDTEKN